MAETDKERIARLEAQYAADHETVKTFGPTAGQLIHVQADLTNLVRDASEFRRWVTEVETRLRAEQQASEKRQEAYARRIEKACGEWADRLDAALPQLNALQNEQDQQRKAWTRREKWLLLFAAALASGAVTLLVGAVSH